LLWAAVLVALGFLVGTWAAAAEEGVGAAVKQGLTPEQQKNLESFDVVWKTVRDTHYDPKLGGVDWEAARKELRPRVEKANSTAEAREVMNELLGRLGHSHVGILPASVYDDPATGKARGEAVPGFDFRMVDGEAVVVRVSAGRPAANAGVRPGWRIHRINGEPIAPALDRVRREVKSQRAVPYVQSWTVRQRLQGEEGQAVGVTFLDGDGKEVALRIPLARPAGNRAQLGQAPPSYIDFESRKVDGTVAYFRLGGFDDPLRVMPAFAETVQQNLKADGFVLDLRGNPGGLVIMTMGIGGWFVDRPGLKLGTTITRGGVQHALLNLREATYEGPLAILVDEFSASSSEILAGGLQDLKRARIFGMRTPGAALPSQFVRLPNGDGLQFVVGDYVSAGGRRLEGTGVQPDEVVPLDRRALLEGRDPTLEAAVRWIRSQRPAAAQK
jgi:carboxyl-terminal processing protease